MTEDLPEQLHDAAEYARFGSIVSAGLGLWLVAAPFVTGYADVGPALWNSMIFGLLIFVFSAVRIALPLKVPILSGLNALFGLWVLFSPFLLTFRLEHAALWSMAVPGLLIAIASIWSASESMGIR